jgi:hypothetical protein
MLEAMATLILVIIGAVLIIFILCYGIYITFFPLSKTVKGGIDALKARSGEKEIAVKKRSTRSATARTRRSHTGTQKREKKPAQ